MHVGRSPCVLTGAIPLLHPAERNCRYSQSNSSDSSRQSILLSHLKLCNKQEELIKFSTTRIFTLRILYSYATESRHWPSSQVNWPYLQVEKVNWIWSISWTWSWLVSSRELDIFGQMLVKMRLEWSSIRQWLRPIGLLLCCDIISSLNLLFIESRWEKK